MLVSVGTNSILTQLRTVVYSLPTQEVNALAGFSSKLFRSGRLWRIQSAEIGERELSIDGGDTCVTRER